MGMANKPPKSTYKRRFHIVSHASNERYRDRFRGTSVGHLEEEHLANYIDEKVVQARKNKEGIEITDAHDNSPGEIVPFGDDSKLWALVKPNNNRHMSKKFPFAIVTVLTDWQAKRSLSGGRWIRRGKTPAASKQAFTLPSSELAKLEAFRDTIPVGDKMAAGEEKIASIKLEFRNERGGAEYKDCFTIQRAEEFINHPPPGLTYVCAWVPARTKEVQRTQLVMETK